MVGSPKNTSRLGVREVSIVFLEYLETIGAGSRLLMTRAGRSLIPARWSAWSRKRNCPRREPICAYAFRLWQALPYLKAEFANMKIPETTISFWIAIRKRKTSGLSAEGRAMVSNTAPWWLKWLLMLCRAPKNHRP